MSSRTLYTENDVRQFAKFLEGCKLPLTVTWRGGKPRSIRQNKLQRLWCNEIAEAFGDRTPEEVRGYCKLTMGVPILRAENGAFCNAYDRSIKSLPYEQKLDVMMDPLDFPVTRQMTTSQKVRYLDHIYRHFTHLGVMLTEPDDRFRKDVERYQAEVGDHD